MVRRKQLTAFQAQQIYQCKAKHLVMGNYVVLDKLGQGGMGMVLKAQHRRMKRLVALKILPPAMIKTADAVRRFQREVEAAAKLTHPNIVTAHDADEANGTHFLVMEYVEGQDLAAVVRERGSLPLGKALAYVLQAARGLEYAHHRGIVHRDIKPSNLLVDAEGKIKILDMGLARIESAGEEQSELTGTGQIMGTIDYMAPEQALNTKDADARADIYALGCSLFFLLTGKAMYEGDTIMKKLLAHREHPIPSLRSACPQAPDELEAVFTKMVAKKRADRYQTMTDVIEALEGCRSRPSNTLTWQSSDAGQRETVVTSDGASASQFSESDNKAFTDFLGNLSAAPARSIARTRLGAKSKNLFFNKHPKPLLIGVAVLVTMMLLAGMVITMKTKDGHFTDSIDIKSGNTESIAAKLVPVEKAAPSAAKPWESPAFRQWVKAVREMPAEKQVEAVSKKLKELNPAFEGKLSAPWPLDESRPPLVEDGNVVELKVVGDNLRDLSPIRALSELRQIDCFPRQNRGEPLDLSPLSGMKIRTLNCNGWASQDTGEPLDVSPLHGTKIRALDCFGRHPDLLMVKSVQLSYPSMAQGS